MTVDFIVLNLPKIMEIITQAQWDSLAQQQEGLVSPSKGAGAVEGRLCEEPQRPLARHQLGAGNTHSGVLRTSRLPG